MTCTRCGWECFEKMANEQPSEVYWKVEPPTCNLSAMSISPDFLKALDLAAGQFPGHKTYPWPSPGNLGGFTTFEDFGQWKAAVLGFRLPVGVPFNMIDLFDRALKLYLTAWLDFDLVTAGEMAALAALEHSLRDCYLGHFQRQHLEQIVEKAKREKRKPRLNENFRPEKVTLFTLLQHMHEQDGLTDDQLPCVQKYGGSVIRLLTGETNPSLTDMRNMRMHGSPFNSGYQSGLLEVVRDLIAYAYRESIRAAPAGAKYHDNVTEFVATPNSENFFYFE